MPGVSPTAAVRALLSAAARGRLLTAVGSPPSCCQETCLGGTDQPQGCISHLGATPREKRPPPCSIPFTEGGGGQWVAAGRSDVAMPRAGSLTGDHAWQIWERFACMGMEPRVGGQTSLLFMLSWVIFSRGGGWDGQWSCAGPFVVVSQLLTGTRVHTGQD